MAGSRPLAPIALALCLAVAPLGAPARDRGADGSFSRRSSSHFVLLQDVDIERRSGPSGSLRFERNVLEVLEAAYARVGRTIGLRPRSRVRVVVYDPGVFDTAFARRFRFRPAGFFDGVIHVRGGARVDARLVRTLHHEYSHAALEASAPGFPFPGWLDEGLAEYFEALAVGKRHLTRGERAFLARTRAGGAWIPLAALDGRGFGGLDADRASVAYLASYATIEHLVRKGGQRSLERLCDLVVRTGDVGRALERVYRRSLAEIERDLLAELR
jgi:hypothetical protein